VGAPPAVRVGSRIERSRLRFGFCGREGAAISLGAMESTGCLQSSLGRAQSLGGLVTKSSARKSKRSVVSVCGGASRSSSCVHGFSASEQWGVAVAAATNTKSVVTTRRKSSGPLKVCLAPNLLLVMSTCKFDSGVNCIFCGLRFCTGNLVL
jgi:hypothetical protein